MQIKRISFIIVAVAALTFSGCKHLEEANINPNKMYTTDVKLIFPGTVYRTMNGFANLNYNYYSNYSRGVSVSFRDIGLGEGDMDRAYFDFYVNVLKDLTNVEREYEGVQGAENRTHMVRAWRAMIYSIIVGTWGPMPMSDAISNSVDKFDFKYDSEKEIYLQILQMLKTATEGFNLNPVTNDFLSPDPVFGTSSKDNIVKWRKFANTLRLDVALRVENIDRGLSEQHVRECMAHEDWLISSVEDMVQPSWGTDVNSDASYYYDRLLRNLTDQNFNPNTYPRIGQYMFHYLQSYGDPRLEKFVDRPNYTDRLAIRDTIKINRKSTYSGLDTTLTVVALHTVPYVPAPEIPRVPETWDVAFDPNSNNGQGTNKYPFPYSGIDNKGWAVVNRSFLKADAKVVFLSWASTCFMQAEAKLKYGVGARSVQQYYESGIAASFAQYGLSPEQLATYMSKDGIKWNTDGKGISDYMQIYYADIHGAGNPLEQIVKQRWISEYFNGFNQWTLERRTRIMNFPPMFYNGSAGLEGSNNRFDFPPERLIYSINERTLNKNEYDKAIELLQAASPKGDRASRWGDNLWTHLQFAKVNPALAGAEATWSNRIIMYNQHSLQNQYGKTEDEMIQIARQEFSGITDTTGLKTYLKYQIAEVIQPRP